MRAAPLFFLGLLMAGCAGSSPCPGAQPPLGQASDYTGVPGDAGFSAAAPAACDDDQIIRVTAAGEPMGVCIVPDAGGTYEGPDSGCDAVSAFYQDMESRLADAGIACDVPSCALDGGREGYGVHDWRQANQAVQIVGETLTAHQFSGPIDVAVVTDHLFCH